MTKTMAEVLAEHTFSTDDTCACTCDEMFYDWRRTPEEVQAEHRLHVEMELHNAGFGLVADAGAKALEDAADDLTWVRPESSPCGDTESCCGSSESCDAMRPSVFTASPAWLRARAAAVRGEG